MLAGVSIALVTGGNRFRSPAQLVIARHQLLVRACCIFLIGGLLQMRVPVRTLLIAAAVVAVVMPVLVPPLHATLAAWGSPYNALSEILVNGGYSGLIWAAYLFLGLAVDRMDLRSERVAHRLIGFGGDIAVAANLLPTALTPLLQLVDQEREFEPPSQFWAP